MPMVFSAPTATSGKGHYVAGGYSRCLGQPSRHLLARPLPPFRLTSEGDLLEESWGSIVGVDVEETYRALRPLRQLKPHGHFRGHYRIRHPTTIGVEAIHIPT